MQGLCLKLLGQSKWATMETLTPSQISYAIDLLDEFPTEMVNDAVWIMCRWGWFRQAGLATKPPWEITQDDVSRLVYLAPWNPSGELELDFHE